MGQARMKKCIFGLLGLSLYFFSAQSQVLGQDLFEPNNTFFDAKEIFLDQPIQATIFDVGDFDFYYFDSPQAGVIEVVISAVGDVDIYSALHDAIQEFVIGDEEGVNQPVDYDILRVAGRHYIEVQEAGSSTRSSMNPYTLTVTLDTSDPQELNNSFQSATRINGGEEIRGTIRTFGDKDYYQFEIEQPGEIRVVVLDVPQAINMEYFLYNPFQQLIASGGAGNGLAIDATLEVTEIGTHYLLLDDGRDNGSSKGIYRFTLSGDPVATSIRSLLGDTGNNAVVDAGDASIVLQSVVGLRTLTSQQREAADVDGNNFVQAADASFILQYVVGLITDFPASGAGKSSADNNAPSLAWGDVQRNPEGNWDLPLKIEKNESQVFALETTLQFDPKEANHLSFTPSLPDDWVIASKNDREGTFRLAMAGTTPISSQEIGTIHVYPSNKSAELIINGSGILNTSSPQPIGEALLATPVQSFTLAPNYPNPFSTTTQIEYSLPEASFVRLRIFNMLGQEVAKLVSSVQPEGIHEAVWDASQVPGGMYFYRLEAGSHAETRALTVLN